MNGIRAIQKLNKRELDEGIAPEASWHTDYRDTAFVYIGGLPFDLSEGDIVTIFSQYGEPVWVKLARDRETGKSRGFAWLKYEDQRSTDLAVDNLGGATIMGRMLRVDHTRYKPKDDEDMRDNTMGELDDDEGGAPGRPRKTESESESDDERPMLQEEIDLARLMNDLDDDDPMKASMVRKKREEADAAVNKYEKARRKAKEREKRHRSRRHHRGRSDSRERDPDRDREHRRIKDVPKSDRRRIRSRDREHHHHHRQEDRKHRDRRRYSSDSEDRYRSDDDRHKSKGHGA